MSQSMYYMIFMIVIFVLIVELIIYNFIKIIKYYLKMKKNKESLKSQLSD